MTNTQSPPLENEAGSFNTNEEMILPTEKKITLYQYIKAEHLEDFINTGELKVTFLSNSNDPLEFFPDFKKHQDLLVWKNHFKNNAPLVVCLSSRMSSPAMWGHYADSHKGVCLAFEIPISKHDYEFTEKSNLNKKLRVYPFLDHKLLKVIYQNNRQKIYSCDKKKRREIILKLIALKSTDWSYEKEYRIWINEKNATPKKGMLFYKGLSDYLSGIILGAECNLSNAYIKVLLRASKILDKKIKIDQAELPISNFKIQAKIFKDTNVKELDNWMIKDPTE